MEVNIPLEIPHNLQEELKRSIVSICLDAAAQANNMYYDLPPYPNKTELRKALKVGNDKIETWIAEGLQMTRFSDNEYRFDREDVRKFFTERKI